MKFYLSKGVSIGFALALVTLCALGAYSYWNTQKSMESSRWVSHTNEVLYNVEKIKSMVIQLESSQRGYTISNKEIFLSKNKNTSDEIRTQIQLTKKLVRDNRIQVNHLDSLSVLIAQKLDWNYKTILTEQSNHNLAVERISSLEGEILKERIIRVVESIEKVENTLLAERMDQTTGELVSFNWSFGALTLFMFALLIVVYLAMNTTFRARIKAQEDLVAVSNEVQDLYNNAPCGYFSLDPEGNFVRINDTLLNHIGFSREEVINQHYFKLIVEDEGSKERFVRFRETGVVTNYEIHFRHKDGSLILFNLSASALYDENRNLLRSRTTCFDITDRKKAEIKVQELAKELEAFTYSVSHDLRAPLRSISGFVKIIEEDYNQVLDQEGKRLLSVIDRNTTDMGNLIDDLLEFARMSRKEMSEQLVDLDDMVNHIIADLSEAEKNRKIDFKLQPLGVIKCDLSMMRQVWINLISNSIKYTRKTIHPVIEISSYYEEKRKIYVIHDNGIGFDMKYGHKLFGVFQRLHRPEDFDGTGVGLALVQRIISRHGGKVWAEGVPNNGATFSFYTA